MNYNYFPNAPYTGQPSGLGGQQYDYGMNNGVTTNMSKVASLDEAIFKSNARPSENIHFHQSNPEFYNVRVDINGNKTWQVFRYDVVGQQNTNPQISRADFDALIARVSALEGKTSEVTENA